MVSVIIPNFNHSKYLVERIDSVLNQTYQDFELIILDDCSTDDSREIIERYRGHDRVSHIIYNEKNSGSTFRQWSRGLGLAKGEYVWIAESDDTAEPTLLEECVAQLEMDSRRVLCYCDSNFIDADSELIVGFDLESLIDKPCAGVVNMKGLEFVRRRLLRHNYIYNASMALFRKDAVKYIDSTYKSFRGCGDWLFWGEVAVQGDVVRVSKRLNNFRQHPNKVTRQMVKERINRLECAEVLAEILQLYVSCAEGKVRNRIIFKTEVLTVCAIIRQLKKTIHYAENPDVIRRVYSLRDRVRNNYRWYKVRALLRLSAKLI